MTYQEDLLHKFTGAYGRLCYMVARSITQGHAPDAVVEAAAGQGVMPSPVYVKLRAQHERANQALNKAIDGHVPELDIVQAALKIRQTVQSEWMMEIPKLSVVSDS